MSNPQETVFVIRGGQGASKTVSIIQLIIQSLIQSNYEASILSFELAKMKRTVIRDYKKICIDWGIFNSDADFNKSESKHEYTNGSYIDFLGADVSDIGKGFRRDILYINEADKLNRETAVQFISRCGITILDYNPDALFWGDEYINENNFIQLTFEDNEYLPISERNSILDYKVKGFFNPDLPFDLLFKDENIKSKYWANKWRVYGLGEVGMLDGVCLTEWKEINAIPKEARLLSYGMDFGYKADPTSVIALYKYNDSYIVDEVIYRKGLLNSDISALLKENGISEFIYADSAEPKSIDELKGYGHKVEPTKKGADSIVYGIGLINQNEIFVTSKSTNLLRELRNYTWKVDSSGNAINKPIDAFNHAIDALRYCITMELSNPNKGQYHIY